jgi:hypothetical protein
MLPINAKPGSSLFRVLGCWFHAMLEGDARSRMVYWVAIALLCLCQGALGWRLAAEVNAHTEDFDQGSYLQMLGQMEGSPFPWLTDGVRNPLVPWIGSVFLDAEDPRLFPHAKRLNVLLGVAGTLALAVFFKRRLGPLAAWNATALAAMALLLPSSTFFGAETTFFVLFFFAFVTANRLLHRNPARGYVLCGLLAGVSALAKPSVAPMLVLFVGWSLVRWVVGTVRPGWFAGWDGWSARRLLPGFLILIAAYLAPQIPRMVHAHHTWGKANYSLPSYWFWAEDWESCVTRYTDCRADTIAAMPPAERPTVHGYFLRNTPADAVHRLAHGTTVRLRQFFHPENKFRIPFDKPGKDKRVVLPHRGFYIIALASCAMVMGLMAWPSPRTTPIPTRRAWIFSAGFLLSMCALYTAAMGWYLPTGPGHRFILTLYLPVLAACVVGADRLRRAASSPPADILFLATHLSIAILLVSRIAILLADGNFRKIDYTF